MTGDVTPRRHSSRVGSTMLGWRSARIRVLTVCRLRLRFFFFSPLQVEVEHQKNVRFSANGDTKINPLHDPTLWSRSPIVLARYWSILSSGDGNQVACAVDMGLTIPVHRWSLALLSHCYACSGIIPVTLCHPFVRIRPFVESVLSSH